MHIPLRIDPGLGRVFDAFVVGNCDSYRDRLLSSSPFPCPLQSVRVAGDSRSKANPRIIAAGVGCGEGKAKRRDCVSSLLCSLVWGLRCSSYEHGPSPKETFCPSPVFFPWLERSRLLQLATTQASQFAGNRFGFCYPFGFIPN